MPLPGMLLRSRPQVENFLRSTLRVESLSWPHSDLGTLFRQRATEEALIDAATVACCRLNRHESNRATSDQS